jgi:D-alanine-D-alanine ligase
MSMKKKIAVLVGGFSHEAEISFKSGATVMKNLDTTKYEAVKINIVEAIWKAEYKDAVFSVDKNDFSFLAPEGKFKFDAVFIAIHGTPGEDGKLQGYFDLLNIPYTTSGVLASSITFHKFYCNNLLRAKGILCADSVLITPHDAIHPDEIIAKLGLPCFAKPCDGGSSFGVTKIKSKEDVIPAVKKALEHGTGCLIESFIEGKEVTCGIYHLNGKTVTLPPTEIVSKNEFFDFDAKYKGESEEITPARISNEMTAKIHSIITEVYHYLGLNGVARIDFIIHNEVPYLIEVNTVPGLSDQSIIPQQARCHGISLETLFTEMLEDAISRK